MGFWLRSLNKNELVSPDARLMRLARCMSKIEGLGRSLEPYFKIIEIFCGAHPDWANIALGAFRLVLQLASHFDSFFEKLCNTIETINAKLPRYQELYDKLCVEPLILRPRLQISLQQTFVSIFEFFQAVANVFSDRRGKSKSSPLVIASLMWKPFDLRFQNVLAKLKFQQKVLQEELNCATSGQVVDDLSEIKLSQAKQATEEAQSEMQLFLGQLRESHDKQTQQQFASSVIRWINPPNFNDNLDQARYERADGTAEWVFQDSIYTAWLEAGPELGTPSQCPKSLLWINGNPGSGKTVLAGSIVDELRRNGLLSSPPAHLCYYFFNQTSGKNNARTDALRAIVAQIFHHCQQMERIHDMFAMVTNDIVTGITASESELLDLICQCLQTLPRVYIVLDGIDECVDNFRIRHDIANWCKFTSVRIVVLSRPDVAWLRNLITPWCKVNVGKEGVSSDIYWYLRPELEGMLEEQYLPMTVDLEDMLRNLVRRAEGMFLFARVMVGYLKSPALSRQQRVDIILEQTPNGLDRLEDLYTRIQLRIDTLDKPSKDLAYKAVMWVAYSQLSTPELKEAMFPEGWNDNDEDGYQQFEHAVIVSCRGLIEKNHNGVYKFIHLTARTYAQKGPERPSTLALMLPAEHISKAILAERCISYLTHKVPGRPLSGEIGVDLDPVSIHKQWPLLRCASANWINFSLDVLENRVPLPRPGPVCDMIQLIQAYLELGLNLMTWIEALFALSGESVSEKLLELRDRVGSFAVQSISADECLIQEMNDFLTDVCRLDDDWHRTLLESPTEIWGDITIFHQSRFFVSTKAGTMESMVPKLDIGDGGIPVKPTFSMSMSSEDAKQLAVLSVFPCKYFRDGWDKQSDIPYYEGAPGRWGQSEDWEDCGRPEYQGLPPTTAAQIFHACTGWFVTYEIFSVLTTKSESKILITVPLDALDVEICLRQSLEFTGDSKGWRCCVPLTLPHSEENVHEDQGLVGWKHQPYSLTLNSTTQISANIPVGIFPSITSGDLIVSSDTDISSLTTCHVSSDEIQLHHKSATGETGVSLVKFPQSIPSEFMSAKVGAPEQDDNFPIYRIILNANPLSYYASAQTSTSDVLPMVIRKDARAVRQCTAKDTIEDS
ncbi:hypothetical protein EG329_004287 [Mollisiaceae sp. DMI_Dod_QoI]|nr:hypothetical protein EG329_004287 [Helotiales sp. DMI_Dod_QoI]